jgi:hypothetical protein
MNRDQGLVTVACGLVVIALLSSVGQTPADPPSGSVTMDAFAFERTDLGDVGGRSGRDRVVRFRAVGPSSGDKSEERAPLSFGEALHLLQTSSTFREALMAALQEPDLEAYFFETPPVRYMELASAPFEFVLADAPDLLEMGTDEKSFAAQLRQPSATGIVAFENLGRDALLCVPVKQDADGEIYTHLASFARAAPLAQRHSLWATVAESLEKRLAQDPARRIWTSTSGLGVGWLHVRLDTTPKYYTWKPYKNAK